MRSIAGNLPLESTWSDYNSYGGELGVRYFFLPRHACVRPYISLSGGATRVESINLTTRAATDFGPFSAGDVVFDGRFYGNSTVATGSVLAGFLFKGAMPWTQALLVLGATICVVSVLALTVRFSEGEETSARQDIQARLAPDLATAGAMGD